MASSPTVGKQSFEDLLSGTPTTAEEITKTMMNITGNSKEAVSVSIEDIAQKDWAEKVYKPDILNKWDKLFKKPGYNPLA